MKKILVVRVPGVMRPSCELDFLPINRAPLYLMMNDAEVHVRHIDNCNKELKQHYDVIIVPKEADIDDLLVALGREKNDQEVVYY